MHVGSPLEGVRVAGEGAAVEQVAGQRLSNGKALWQRAGPWLPVARSQAALKLQC